MNLPFSNSQFHVDDGITAFAVSQDSELIAIGTVGMLGIYRASSMKHLGSYIVPGNHTKVTNIAFNKDGLRLMLKTEDGITRELMVGVKDKGYLKVVKTTARISNLKST